MRGRYPRELHVAALLAVVCALACAERSGDAPGVQSTDTPEEAPRIILLISVDTLRPDRLGSYGYGRETSPHIDALAGRGVLFEDVTSVAPWTLPAHATMLTGLAPLRHGVKSWYESLAEGVPTLASRLASAGYRTGAAVNSKMLDLDCGLTIDFERFVYVKEVVSRRWPSTLVTNRGLEWIDEWEGEPVFLFLHYYDVHSDYASLDEFEALFTSPYDGPWDGTTSPLDTYRHAGGEPPGPRDVSHLLDLYDAGIRQMDAELGRLFEALSARELLGETLVVLTSDHGEEFLEHGSTLHGSTMYQEVLAIPLIFSGPGVPSGLRVATPVSLVDLVPTVLALAGVEGDASLDGTNLAALWEGQTAAGDGRLIFSESDWKRPSHDELRAVRRGAFKLIYNRRTREQVLYDLEVDPGETRDVAAAHPRIVAELRAGLDAYARGVPTNAPAEAAELSPEVRAHLESLGYVE